MVPDVLVRRAAIRRSTYNTIGDAVDTRLPSRMAKAPRGRHQLVRNNRRGSQFTYATRDAGAALVGLSGQ
jgi:hypothetical protein